MKKKYILMGLVIALGVAGCIISYINSGDSSNSKLMLMDAGNNAAENDVNGHGTDGHSTDNNVVGNNTGKDDESGWFLKRNEYGQGDYKIKLRAKAQDIDYDIDVNVQEREYSEEELDRMAASAYEELKKAILNGNESLERISSDINPVSSLPGYPFSIRWKVSDEKVLDIRGRICCPIDCNDKHDVVMTSQLIYGEYVKSNDIPIRIIHGNVSDDELLKYRIISEIDGNLADETSSLIKLPAKINDREISWDIVEDNKGFLYLGLSIIGAMLLSIAYDYDEVKAKKKREEIFESDYPYFVEKMKLYILSGLSVPNVFELILRDTAESMGRDSLLFTELEKAVNMLRNGVREEKVYDLFGMACRGSYKKLCFLLSVNLRKGNDRLLEMLEEENAKAQEIRKQLIIRKSDEAGIKLLFPMVLMLLVIMMLIMIPAYLNIGI